MNTKNKNRIHSQNNIVVEFISTIKDITLNEQRQKTTSNQKSYRCIIEINNITMSKLVILHYMKKVIENTIIYHLHIEFQEKRGRKKVTKHKVIEVNKKSSDKTNNANNQYPLELQEVIKERRVVVASDELIDSRLIAIHQILAVLENGLELIKEVESK